MKSKLLLSLFFLAPFTLLRAGISESDAARLGQDLTPLGAEQAGNAAGTIPAWTGGITTPPAGYHVGDHHPDPYAADAPLYTINADNAAQYQDKLTAGHLALLKAYPDYKLIVYPTHRSASNPPRVYEAVKANATTAELVAGGNGITGAVIGVPFPIPHEGLEVVWNHLTRYRGLSALRHIAQGDAVESLLREQILCRVEDLLQALGALLRLGATTLRGRSC